MNQTFPKDKIEALTMLYLEKQDFSKLSAEEFAKAYRSTHDEIAKILKPKTF